MTSQHSIKTIKTFNDPIYGFITITDPLLFQIIEHPYFQRLRRIAQLGLTNLVYSGANHSRFQHALGAMNLMHNAISVLRSKGVDINDEEEQAAKIAILLHDIGHGPFSHALENTIVKGIDHEAISAMVFKKLNKEFDGRLEMAYSIYQGSYPKSFLHELVSSQLDVDRLDYLKRDSFFTGVSEGVIGSDRIIKMMTVVDGKLAVEAKGIYSLEKFLVARRLMYWQVYLHKTVLSAEFMLMNLLIRAQEVFDDEVARACSPALASLLKHGGSHDDEGAWLENFLQLDDFDVHFAIKQWRNVSDEVLAELSRRLMDRELLKTRMSDVTFDAAKINEWRADFMQKQNAGKALSEYLIFQKHVDTNAYDSKNESINIFYKDQSVRELTEAANIFKFASLETRERKHFLYYPKEAEIQ